MSNPRSNSVLANDPLYLQIAFSKLGLSEIAGARNEKQVLAMYAASAHAEVTNDEVPWCAAYVGWCLHEAGLPNTGSLLAKSYVKYGTPVPFIGARVPRAAIAVWTRTGGNHVNFVLEDDGTYLTCIGGNQENGQGGGVTVSRRAKSSGLLATVVPNAKKTPKKPVGEVKFEPKSSPSVTPEVTQPNTAVVTPSASPAIKQEQIEQSAENDAETRGSWLSRKWKGLTAWVSGGAGVGVFGALTDPWVIVAIASAVVVIVVLIVLFMGPGDVRAWVRKQVT